MNYSTLFFPIVLSLALVSGCKQLKPEEYFTGTVSYHYTYSSDSLDADSIRRMKPAYGYFRYDHKNYQSKFVGNDTLVFYYSGNLNRCLSVTRSTGKYDCEDYGILTDSVLSWKIYDVSDQVLGQSCRVLELQKKNSSVKYYVSKKWRIAPSTYQHHRSYNWNFYGSKAGGGLILKSEHRFPGWTMHGIVTEVKMHKGDFIALELDEKKLGELCRK